MKINVWNTILQLSKERGVEPVVIVRAVEESLRVASSKYFTHGEKVLDYIIERRRDSLIQYPLLEIV